MATITIACAVALAVVATNDNHLAHANHRNKILKHARDSLETEHLLLHRRSYTTVKSAKLTFTRVVAAGLLLLLLLLLVLLFMAGQFKHTSIPHSQDF